MLNGPNSGLLATHKWSARAKVCRPQDRSIRSSQRHAAVGFPVIFSGHSHHPRCNASFLWGHQCSTWSIWIHTSRFHFAHDLLQCDLQAKTEPNFLGEHITCHTLLSARGLGSNIINSSNNSWCQHVPPLCKHLTIATIIGIQYHLRCIPYGPSGFLHFLFVGHLFLTVLIVIIFQMKAENDGQVWGSCLYESNE